MHYWAGCSKQAAASRSKPQQAAASRSMPQQAAAGRSMPQQAAAGRSRPQQAEVIGGKSWPVVAGRGNGGGRQL